MNVFCSLLAVFDLQFPTCYKNIFSLLELGSNVMDVTKLCSFNYKFQSLFVIRNSWLFGKFVILFKLHG